MIRKATLAFSFSIIRTDLRLQPTYLAAMLVVEVLAVYLSASIPPRMFGKKIAIVRQNGVQLDLTSTAQGETTGMNRDRAQYRPTAEQKDLLVRAAGLTGQTLSDFMRTAVEERAKRVIADHERIVLNERARTTFLSALAKPPQPNDRLVALADRYAREVTSRP